MKNLEMRLRIAQATARLLAMDGSQDYGSAKRKAARQLGAPDSQNLPDNQEIEGALREYQGLFQTEESRAQLTLLRQIAIEYMEQLAEYDPHLTGSVLNGTAGKHSDINLQLFSDEEKEIEFLLMRLPHPYRVGEYRSGEPGGPVFPRFAVDDPRASIDITVYPANELRRLKRFQADGTPRRLRLRALTGANAE
jgi:hypothetical protein